MYKNVKRQSDKGGHLVSYLWGGTLGRKSKRKYVIEIKSTMNIGVHRFFWMGLPGSLGYNPSSGITGSKASFIFSFLRKFHIVFHSGLHLSAIPPTVH